MAATVAGLIRGRDVVTDAQALRTVAAQQLDVDALAFGEIISVMESANLVEGVVRKAGRIVRFRENVPYYESLYSKLGLAWEQREPTTLEQQMLVVIDGLADAPVPLEELENKYRLDRADTKTLLDVGQRSQLIKRINTMDGDIVYSPFFGFEKPEVLGSLVASHGSGQLAEEFARVRNHQGFPVDADQHPLLMDAVARGLLAAPSVALPNGQLQSFAALPYVPDRKLLVSRKPVLEKALAVLACLRCGQYWADFNTLESSQLVAVINKLLDPGRGWLNPNSSHERQYDLLVRAGLITFEPDTLPGGDWVTPVFIDTEDNREALELARDLIIHGEPFHDRVGDAQARRTLQASGKYTAPMQTLERVRDQVSVSNKDLALAMRAALGQAEL